MEAIKMVLAGAIGVRRKSAHERAKVHPAQIVIVALVVVVLFILAIRTLVYAEGSAHWGVGAGIVADSEPEREWQETLSKGRALWLAVQRAERGVE